MSNYAREQTNISSEELARDMNAHFGFVASRLPTEIKTAPAGASIALCQLAGIGQLAATYSGQRYQRTGSAQHLFVVRLTALADGYDGRLGFMKDFGLTYSTFREQGELVDLQPAVPQEFSDCPDRDVLAHAVQCLREEYGRLRSV